MCYKTPYACCVRKTLKQHVKKHATWWEEGQKGGREKAGNIRHCIAMFTDDSVNIRYLTFTVLLSLLSVNT